jgi:hypothetical protein
MGLTDYARQFAQKGKPVPLKLINNIDFTLLSKFSEGNGITESEADQLVAELASQFILARKWPWKDKFIVYVAKEVGLKKKKQPLPATFRKVEGRNFIIVDPLGFKKSAGEANALIASFRGTGQKAIRFPYNDGFVVYRSTGPAPVKKRRKASKKTVKKKVAPKPEKLKIPPKQQRTQAWFDALTPRMKQRYSTAGYSLKIPD